MRQVEVTAEKGQLYATCPLQDCRPIPAWDKEDLGGSSNARAAKARFQKAMGTSKRIHCLGALSEDRVPTDRICVHRITLHGTLCTCVDPMQRLAYTCASGLTGKDTGCLPVYEKVYRMLRAEYPN